MAITKVVRQNQEVGGDLVSGPHLGTEVVEEAQQPLNHERLTGIALLGGEFECAFINLLHFGGCKALNRHQRDAQDYAQLQLSSHPFSRTFPGTPREPEILGEQAPPLHCEPNDASRSRLPV